MRRFILVENITEPVLIELQAKQNGGGYIVFPKKNLDKLPAKIKKLLVKNGLYQNINVIDNKFDSYFSLHRLVLCLYQNIVGSIVHHILNNPKINNICNLLKVKEKEHKHLHNLEIEAGRAKSYKMQQEQIKPSRNTLAKNYDLVLKILKLRGL